MSDAVPIRRRYRYDALDRLVAVELGDGTTIAWAHDAAGNRLSERVAPPADEAARGAGAGDPAR